MQGVQAFEPKAKASIDLESFIAEDHFLRQIDRRGDKAQLELFLAGVRGWEAYPRETDGLCHEGGLTALS